MVTKRAMRRTLLWSNRSGAEPRSAEGGDHSGVLMREPEPMDNGASLHTDGEAVAFVADLNTLAQRVRELMK